MAWRLQRLQAHVALGPSSLAPKQGPSSPAPPRGPFVPGPPIGPFGPSSPAPPIGPFVPSPPIGPFVPSPPIGPFVPGPPIGPFVPGPPQQGPPSHLEALTLPVMDTPPRSNTSASMGPPGEVTNSAAKGRWSPGVK
ncbi:unnamed protein product [Arctogadus glacialis]